MRRLAYILGSGLGSGYVPYAPGTAGSLVALMLFYLLPLSDHFWLIICIIFFVLGIWSSAVIEKEHSKDPKQVVIDEWVGQWLTLIYLPRSLSVLILGFLLFRITDIIKPWPARQSQDLKGGLGIMIDDVIAAVYANLALRLFLWLYS